MRTWKPTSLLLASLMALAACSSTPGTSTEPNTAESSAPESTAPESTTPESTAPVSPAESMDMDMGGETAINSDAASLRTDLDYLLGEHLILAAKATGAALDGRSEEFEAYGAC